MTQRRILLLLAAVLIVPPVPLCAQPVGATGPVEVPSNSTMSAVAADERPKTDAVAGRFAVMCSGCHSLTGAKLSGPELTPSTGWPLEQLKAAIKRMEKNVGPLTEEQVTELAGFMKAPDIRERLKAEQERIQAQFMARMAPPDAAEGRKLFFGTRSLRHGGLACAACHAVQGVGGSLGVDLTGVAGKMGGETPLVSAIEQAAFKLMAPHYKRHPVTKQEAMHLARFLASLTSSQTAAPRPAFVPWGGGVGLAMMLGLVLTLRQQRRRRGRDAVLQRRKK